MGRKKKTENDGKERIPCALGLPDGHYLENDWPGGGSGNGFDVKNGEIYLSPGSFAPMEAVTEKRDRIQALVRLHNSWFADELAGIAKAEEEFWDRIMDKLSIPQEVNITINRRGVIRKVPEKALKGEV